MRFAETLGIHNKECRCGYCAVRETYKQSRLQNQKTSIAVIAYKTARKEIIRNYVDTMTLQEILLNIFGGNEDHEQYLYLFILNIHEQHIYFISNIDFFIMTCIACVGGICNHIISDRFLRQIDPSPWKKAGWCL